MGPWDGDAVARACTSAYAGLGRSGKPAQGAQQRQWTVLAGAVLLWSGPADGLAGQAVVSLATGVKCLPYTQFGAHGDVVHDQHAEVLVRRGLRRWIVRQLLADAGLADPPLPGLPDHVFRPSPDGRWTWNNTYSLSLYVSRVPCGAASAALLPADEASVYPTTSAAGLAASGPATGTGDQHGSADPEGPTSDSDPTSRPGARTMRGRTDLSIDHRDRVRTKPGRLDAPVATSMSCSDKLALWNQVGLQGSLLSRLLVHPVRYTHIVVGCDGLGLTGLDDSDSSAARARVLALQTHLEGALIGRVQKCDVVPGSSGPGQRPGPALAPPREQMQVRVHVTSVPFEHAQDNVAQVDGGPLIACADAVSFVPSLGVTKLSPLGTKAGAPSKRVAGKPLRPQSRSPLCKAMWFAEFSDAVRQLDSVVDGQGTVGLHSSGGCTYGAAKRTEDGGTAYRPQKAAVRGSDADGVDALRGFLHAHHVEIDADIDVPYPPHDSKVQAPLAGWLVSGPTCEAFNLSP